MDSSLFNDQVKRLRTQWPHAYGEERIKILWAAFKDVSNYDFRDAVSYCLGNSKSAPLVLELEKAIQVARNNYYSQKRLEEASTMGALLEAADNNKTADPEFVDRCLKLLDDLYNKKITKKQFDEGCDLLDQAAKLYRKPSRPLPEKYTKPVFDEDKPF